MSARLPFIAFQVKRLFILYPEIAYTALLATVVGVPLGVYKLVNEYHHPNSIVKAYKPTYTVYRPDDPRSYRIKCTPDLPPGDPHILRV
ncbi:hypothetical protein RvY_18839 [Ramazzottius varieornatus]|uniref:Uncharacterized protein n=1 Tax=Ramazzottius varieornatus TaxID=947166 RepID=A0A1D1W770_RAMVA|nr:hypothetical protein RvY_18839 [Ramazzottius varieornatus]